MLFLQTFNLCKEESLIWLVTFLWGSRVLNVLVKIIDIAFRFPCAIEFVDEIIPELCYVYHALALAIIWCDENVIDLFLLIGQTEILKPNILLALLGWLPVSNLWFLTIYVELVYLSRHKDSVYIWITWVSKTGIVYLKSWIHYIIDW